MNRIITYGATGYCENCNETHDHPMHNIIEIIQLPDLPEEGEGNTPEPWDEETISWVKVMPPPLPTGEENV